MGQPRQYDLLGIQCLRAVAALLVVAYHAVAQWTSHMPGYPPGDYLPNGSAGVDIFIVISGLVMTISAQRRAGRPHPAWTFSKDRIIRIVPLYWVITTLKIVCVRLPRWLLAGGHASYASYLTHGFVIPVVFILCALSIHLDWAGLGATIVVGLVASAVVGYITHHIIEQPLLLSLRTRRIVFIPSTPG